VPDPGRTPLLARRWMSPRTRRLAVAALVAASLAGTTAPAALGHAALSASSPAAGARVESAPARVVLTFTEPLQPDLSEATLRDDRGRRVDAALSVRGRRMTLAPADELARGAYSVRWRTVSTQDAHPLEGSFGFGIGVAPAAGSNALEESPVAGGGWARALAHGLLYAALLLFAGALLCRALLGPGWPARREPPPATPPPADPPPATGGGVATIARPRTAAPPSATRDGGAVAVSGPRDAAAVAVSGAAGSGGRAEAVVFDAGLAAVALAAVAAAVDAADAAGGLSVDGLRAYLLSDTPGIARVLLVALLGVALALARRAPRGAALAALAALGCVVASGHANSAEPRGVAVLADWAHLAAGAVWLGGAALILATWGARLRDAARDVLPAFGRIALPAFLAVVAAGIVNAVVELSSVTDLWETAYGRVLLAKVLLVAAAAGAAWTHAYRRRDAAGGGRSWALRVEVGLGVAVVMVAGLLVAFPLPPQQLDAATRAAGALAACDPCPLPAPRPDELAVAGQAGPQVVAAWIRRDAARLSGTIRTLDSRGRPGAGRIDVPGGGVRSCGRGCATFETAPPPPRLRVNVTVGGRVHAVSLPATWRRGESARARRLVARAQAAMRALRSVREDERVSSGPGMHATTRYRLVAPDRLAFETGGGVRTVQIGRTQWLRTPGNPWRRSAIPGGVPFRTRSWFRWTPYARAAQVLRERGRTTEVALADPATPVWMRLTIEERTGRVLRERIAARARFIERRFHAFDAPLEIVAPT